MRLRGCRWRSVSGRGKMLFRFAALTVSLTLKASPLQRGALNKLGSFEGIVAEGIAQPQGEAVAILYSESSDIWFSSVGTIGAGLRSMYLAFRHAGLPVQVFTEHDCAAGRLFHTDLLVVAVPNVAESAAQAIAEWVRAGGAVLATAG